VDADREADAALPGSPGQVARYWVDIHGPGQVGEGNTQIIASYNTNYTIGRDPRANGVAPFPLADDNGASAGPPYRGLAPFGEQDALFFFGREQATAQILECVAGLLSRPGLLMVSGAPGAGKSSLLQAGVLSRIRDSGLAGAPESAGWPCAVLTPGREPLAGLASVAALAGIDAATTHQALKADPADFALTARQVADSLPADARPPGHAVTVHSRRLLLIIDQLEQLFTQCSDEDQRRAFLTALHAAATAGHGLVGEPAALVVLVVRSDFESRCAEYPLLAGAVQDRYLVTAMTERQLRMAITEPAKKAGSHVDDDLVTALLDDTRSRAPGTAARAGILPLLSHALDTAWRARAGASLTVADYERAGGIERAVADLERHSESSPGTSVSDSAPAEAEKTGTAKASRPSPPPLPPPVDLGPWPVVDLPGVRAPSPRPRRRRNWPAVSGLLLTLVYAALVILSLEAQASGPPVLLIVIGYAGEAVAVIVAFAALLPRLRPLMLPAVLGGWFTNIQIYQAGPEAAPLSAFLVTDAVTALVIALLFFGVRRISGRGPWARPRRLAVLLLGGAALSTGLWCLARVLQIRSSPFGHLAGDPSLQIAESAVELAAAALVTWLALGWERRLAGGAMMLGWSIEQILGLLSWSAEGPAFSGGVVAANWTAALLMLATATLAVVYLRGPSARPPRISRCWTHARRHLRLTAAAAVAVAAAAAFVLVQLVPGTGSSATLTDPGGKDIRTVAFAPGGATLAVGDGHSVYLWNVSARTLTATLTDPARLGADPNSQAVKAIAFAPDSTILAVADDDGSVYLWDTVTRKLTAAVPDPGAPDAGDDEVTSVAFEPGSHGIILAFGELSGSTILWNTATRKITATLNAPGAAVDYVNAVAFAPGSTTLAVAQFGGTISLWDTVTRKLTATLSEPDWGGDGPDSVAFGPGGTALAADNGAQGAYAWNTVTGKRTAVLADPGSQGVTSVAFEPGAGDTALAVGDLDGSTYLWDTATRKIIASLTVPGGSYGNGVTSIAFGPGGATLAAGSMQGSTYLQPVTRHRDPAGGGKGGSA
jgi:hypothetical protein